MKPIPDGRRDKKKFDDAPAVLAWILRTIDARRKSPIKVNVSDRESTDRVLALFMLLRTSTSHAKTILASTRRGVAEAGQVNLRAILELWADFNYIRRDTSGAAQRQMFVAGALVLLRREPNAKTEAELCSRFPSEFAAAQARLAKNPFAHWSGKGRKAMVKTYCGKEYADLYEVLSWDVHPVLPAVLDVTAVNADAGQFRLQHRLPQAQVALDNCIMAAHIVRKMWNDLASDY